MQIILTEQEYNDLKAKAVKAEAGPLDPDKIKVAANRLAYDCFEEGRRNNFVESPGSLCRPAFMAFLRQSGLGEK